jgi:hypothetical protein
LLFDLIGLLKTFPLEGIGFCVATLHAVRISELNWTVQIENIKFKLNIVDKKRNM